MIKDIRVYLLSLVAGVFLFATPANIASDAVLQGCSSPESTVIYGVGLLALFGTGYCLGIITGEERQKKADERKAKRC